MNPDDLIHNLTSDAALYLWDYFYLKHAPCEAERRPWRRIEAASVRIRESEQLLRASYPAAVRVANAKRVRRAVREIVRLIFEELETLPEEDIARALGLLEGRAQAVIDEDTSEARARPLH